MENIYVKAECLPQWLAEGMFYKKDLISIEEILEKLEEYFDKWEAATEELEDFKADVRDNYKYIGMREAIGYDEKTW